VTNHVTLSHVLPYIIMYDKRNEKRKKKIKRKEDVLGFSVLGFKGYHHTQISSYTSTILIDTPLFIPFPYGLDSILVLNCL